VNPVLIDTGPLLAAINRSDRWHEWSREQFRRARPPLLTCESVISESWFLLQQTDVGRQTLLELLRTATVEIALAAQDHVGRLTELMEKYADVPMSLADACLVRMSELVPKGVVLTLDGDFRIYRRHKRQSIPLLIPPDV
jgi:predicted nucleic acid-binding protein